MDMGDWIIPGMLFVITALLVAIIFRMQGATLARSQDANLSATKRIKPKREPPTFEPDFQKVGALKHYEEQIQTAVHGIAFHSDDSDGGLDKDYWIDWLTKMEKKRREVLDSIDEDEKLFKAVSRIVKQS